MFNQRFNPRKNFKRRFPQNQNTSNELIQAIRAIQVVKKDDVGLPEKTYVASNAFSNFSLSEQLQNNVVHKGYTAPTPIQDQAINHILDGRDVIGIANTGTGKTAAFLIPLLEKVSRNKNERVLIITPTRELAAQIYEELHAFAKGLGVTTVLCIGGMSLGRQRSELNQHPNFVIGTPGRIKDLIEQRGLVLSQFHTVVLDEADRMVDIGFINDIKYFISLLPLARQSLFFSATVSGKVKEILETFVHNAVTVSVKQQDTAETIEQDIIKVVDKYKKVDQLHDLLIQKEFEKVLIFGRTKWGIQKLTNELIKRGFKAGAIHGNKSQNQRLRILDQFKHDEIRVLLATDVASRGLDISDVSHVINYDMPASYDDYVHRIGRTGRANKKGMALTFVD